MKGIELDVYELAGLIALVLVVIEVIRAGGISLTQAAVVTLALALLLGERV